MENSFIIKRNHYIHECFESFFQVKIYSFHIKTAVTPLNILREGFYNKTLFIKIQINESD